MSVVIINADDFGLNEHCSKAIAEAFSKELVTDTTMMATGEYFEEAVTLSKEQGFCDKIGIHFNLTEGEPLTEDIKNCDNFVRNGRFHKEYNRLKPLSSYEKQAIYKELSAQAKKIEDAGIKIMHADSHHHVHTAIYVAPIVARVCKEHDINKIRLHRNLGQISSVKRLVKKKYNHWLKNQGFITTDYFAYVMDIEDMPIPDGTEIMVHPDYDANGVLIDRKGMTDGIPFGEALKDFVKERQVILGGYTKL
ncbi:MAG: ChbG/HpnK family deacetylase [Ruminococcus sp.]|nr:ChbG/HpnK family deacetylase [Ruminococcus sp.]